MFGKRVGGGLVKAMPHLMHGLSIVGTAAMLWVGGGIIVHGLHVFHVMPARKKHLVRMEDTP